MKLDCPASSSGRTGSLTKPAWRARKAAACASRNSAGITKAVDLVRVALDVDLFVQGAQFRNQDVGIESIDPDLFAIDIALDN